MRLSNCSRSHSNKCRAQGWNPGPADSEGQMLNCSAFWPVSGRASQELWAALFHHTTRRLFLQFWSFQHSFYRHQHTITPERLLWENWPKLCLCHITVICNINRTPSVSKHCSCHWQFMLIPEIASCYFWSYFDGMLPQGPLACLIWVSQLAEHSAALWIWLDVSNLQRWLFQKVPCLPPSPPYPLLKTKCQMANGWPDGREVRRKKSP